MADLTEQFADAIRAAGTERPLCIRGGGSKDFYGGPRRGELLDTRAHAGIVSYEPTELVITARAGTPLAEIEATLAGQGQFLACEPPRFGEATTIGGAVAAGLSGPRRATAGALRDFVLGVTLLDGEARVLKFGGQVMKNVAGYDVSRLVAGSLGTLGVILDVSLKVLPMPVAEATLRFEVPEAQALAMSNEWAGKPLAVSATCWSDNALMVRVSGAKAAVDAALRTLGGKGVPEAEAATFWRALRDQRLDWFADEAPLWRLSLPPTAPSLAQLGAQLVEWHGGQRWLRSDASAMRIREAAKAAGGHATRFRGGDAADAFTPLPAPLLELHSRVKAAFDPRGVLNPGRLYPDF